MTPTDEQVEAVAKALAWAARHPLDVSTDADDLWPHHTTESQELYLSQARAAIAAMQPTVAQAAEVLLLNVSNPAHENCREAGDDFPGRWYAKTQAWLRALTEPQQEDEPMPCPECGCEDFTSAGYLRCECPALSKRTPHDR